MNLKEAFRYQNKLQNLMGEAQLILSRERNVTKVENTYLRHKVNPEDQDETTLELPGTEYAGQITEIAMLLMFLLEQREQLSYAIREAKKNMDMDFDGEISLNAKRQELADIFRRMSQIRSSERIHTGAGTGYKFNAEGNQVSYCCDLKQVISINFDRNKIRAYTTHLNQKSDRVSAELDKRMVNTEVRYDAPFDVNDTFDEIIQWYTEQNS